MKKDKRSDIIPEEGPGQLPAPPIEKKHAPIKVSLGVYLISIIVVFLVVFIVMLVQYLPGHRAYSKIKGALQYADSVEMSVVVYREDLPEEASYTPTDEEKELADVLLGTGANKAEVIVVQESKKLKEEEEKEQQQDREERENGGEDGDTNNGGDQERQDGGEDGNGGGD